MEKVVLLAALAAVFSSASRAPLPEAERLEIECEQVGFVLARTSRPIGDDGCDLQLRGYADMSVYWGGCNSNSCTQGDCQQTTNSNGEWLCECSEDPQNPSNCTADVEVDEDGLVLDIDCKNNGCDISCTFTAYKMEYFYPCDC